MEVFWFILFWVMIFVLIFAWPTWPYTRERDWGYGPSAVAAAIAVALLLLFWLGLLAVWVPWGPYYY